MFTQRRSYRVLATLLVLSATSVAVAEEAAVTIIGAGKGPIHIVGKDGSVEELSAKDLELPVAPGVKAQSSAKPLTTATAKADTPAKAQTPKTASQPADKPKSDPNAVAAAQAKAAAKAKKDKQKELQHYADKDYTYGPGSASKTDKTSVVLKNKGVGKAAKQDEVDTARKPVKVEVGGEVRIRANRYSR